MTHNTRTSSSTDTAKIFIFYEKFAGVKSCNRIAGHDDSSKKIISRRVWTDMIEIRSYSEWFSKHASSHEQITYGKNISEKTYV